MPKTFTPLSVNFVYSSLNSNSQTLPLICLLFFSIWYPELLPEAADFLGAPRSCSPGVKEDDDRASPMKLDKVTSDPSCVFIGLQVDHEDWFVSLVHRRRNCVS